MTDGDDFGASAGNAYDPLDEFQRWAYGRDTVCLAKFAKRVHSPQLRGLPRQPDHIDGRVLFGGRRISAVTGGAWVSSLGR